MPLICSAAEELDGAFTIPAKPNVAAPVLTKNSLLDNCGLYILGQWIIFPLFKSFDFVTTKKM